MSPWVLVVATAVFIALRVLAPRGAVDLTALATLKAPFDAVAFALRNRLRWRRGAPPHPNEAKDALFAGHAPALRDALAAREASLRARYDLADLHARSSAEVYRENLYVLDALDAHADQLPARPALRALDVGSKDFCYATALHRWLRHGGASPPREVRLDGIELDGYPVYRDGYARADHAEAYAREAGDGVRYRVEDFLATADRDVDVVFFWYPFVLRYALRRWGLPGRHFAPASLFRRAADALRPGGLLVVVNHTQEEHQRLREILAEVPGLVVLHTAPVTSAMIDYHDTVTERVMTLARRSTDHDEH
ncbi:MAG: hypothetical protein U0325_26425 [Polyangiales bacterium]